MELKKYFGVVTSKKCRIGTRSEAPEYSIELENPNEFGQRILSIRKEAHLWEVDPALEKCVGKKVEILGEPVYTKHVKFEGTIKSEGIIYKETKIIKGHFQGVKM
jgi:hypothetical protein